jgi:hypothetical protein
MFINIFKINMVYTHTYIYTHIRVCVCVCVCVFVIFHHLLKIYRINKNGINVVLYLFVTIKNILK